ncbi:MAG TPA: hypothetical protein VK828_08285 [Terriglobales bacterium]|nr:hypothetical protein [Terriglobales bacterium]
MLSNSFDEKDKDDDRPDRRAQWMMRGREVPKGQSAAALRLRAHQQKMALRAARAAAAKAGTSPKSSPLSSGWIFVGPAPLQSDGDIFGLVSGRSTAIAVDPSDTTGNTVYAAGATGGVWKSTNAATSNSANVSWTPVTDQQASLTDGAVSVKSDGSVVLVGTGEPNNAIDSYFGSGILVSNDKGNTWTLVPSSSDGHSFVGMGFSKFAWDTATGSTSTVVAAGADTPVGDQTGAWSNNPSWGIYLSTNDGASWTSQAPTDGTTPVFSVTDVVYNATAGKFFASLQYHGVYSSTNGTNWTRLAAQPSPSFLSLSNCPLSTNLNDVTCPLFRGQLTVVPGRNEMYFWFIDGNLQDYGIWQSLNGGTSWKQVQASSQCTLDPDTSNPPCGMLQPFYNLELGAIPNGSNTDLYAGLVNLYKCRVNSGTQSCATIDSNQPNSWINLTQVYSCPQISGVHPDEHGFGFEMVGGQAVTYFGNDGGVYRSLNSLTGLVSGTCGTANQFDNLNGTIGSMTQFVSFSIHPTDQNILLGGTQDNGSPATDTATTSPQFTTVLGGDGGYNAINPNNTSEWFPSTTDSLIGICESGIGCNENNTFIEAQPGYPSEGNIDQGAFYTPFILDQQNTGEMLIGTCRIWRGSTNPPDGPGVFSELSVDFDTLDSTLCSGGEINQVRSLAAGGPKDSNGFSNVVYAATQGYGPLYAFGTGGEVWVTTDAATTMMSNVSPPGNANNNYTVSSVAMDNSDATGKTAYVGIMGFNTSHVWKTTDAGGTGQASDWTDWTGNLPDSPVNALLVDSTVSPSQIYAGTDVGIFVSSTTNASWTEVGPAPGSGQAGYLPNVPVTALQLFNSGGTKALEVSTYGRGIWTYSLSVSPSFTLSAAPSAVTIAAGGTGGTSTITVNDQNGFTGSVSLAASGLPSGVTASFNPTSTSTTSVLTLTASGSAAPGTATVTITGTSGSLTATTTVSLTVTPAPSFTLSASPTSLTITPGGAGGTSTITVGDQNGFSSSVALAASGLPSGVTATFNPTSTASTSTLTLTASGSAAASGPTTVTITGTSGSLTATTTIAVTVSQNFTVPPTLTNPASAGAGQSTSTTMALAPVGGGNFTSNVTYACTSGLPTGATCSFSPTQISSGTGGQTVTITIQTTGPFTGAAGGAKRGEATRRLIGQKQQLWLPLSLPLAGIVMVGLFGGSLPRRYKIIGLCLALTITGFLVACGGGSSGSPPVQVTPASAQVQLGGTQQFTASGTVTWSVSGSGTISPTSGLYTAPTTGTTPASATVTATPTSGMPGTAAVTIPAVGVSVSPSSVNTLYPSLPGAPLQTQTFTPTVTNSTANTTVTWSVNGVAGGNATFGTIDGSGNYTAPASLPNPATFNVTATSVADPSKSGPSAVSLLTPTPAGTSTVTVTVTEGGIQHTTTFSLTVTD